MSIIEKEKSRSANGCDILPEEFHSISEAANFWDTHDSIDYESMMKDEHNPPHFHAEYQGQRGVFDFNGNLIKGHITDLDILLRNTPFFWTKAMR